MAGIFDQFLSGYESGDALRQQREQEKKRGLLSQYASQAMSAPREQRAGLLGQIAAVDPSAAYDAQKHFGEMDERTRADLGRSLAVFSSLPDEEKAAAYPEIAQRAHSIGMPVPTEYKPEFGPRMAQLAQILSGGEQQDATPSAIRELQMLQSNPELLALDMKRRQAGWQPQRITDDDGNLYWATPGGPVVPAEVGMSDSPGNDDVYPGGDIYSAVEQVESGGNPYAVSPAGAIGPMQTMPGTLRDPGFGVAPARSNSVDEQRRVGQDYLDAMIAQYGPEGGLAAYNWGPGNWQAALKRTGGNVQAALALAPKETRDYVPKVQRRLAGGPTFGGKRKDEGSIPAGWVRTAEGRLAPMPGGPADRKANPLPADQAKDERAMRKELTDLVEKDRSILGMYKNVESASTNNSAAGDLSLIFAFMKMLDPGSVVREQEFANAQNAAGVPDRIRNMWNKVKAGERLNPNQRADFLNQARQLASSASQRITSTTREYQSIADQYGYDPVRATGMADFRSVGQPQQTAPQSGGGGVDDLLSKYGVR